ncbi:MAG: hypothetical protein H0T41_10655 [Rhodobacteraceae bacterium]|nr:hypothetical protein [Paracoccaceae bacterium]
MSSAIKTGLLLATLTLAACSDGPPAAVGPADIAADAPNEAQETIAPGPDGLYEGDPLAGPDLDPSADPL